MKNGYFIKQLFGALIFFSVIFISAGTLHFTAGIIYTALGLTMFALNHTAFKLSPELLKERSSPKENTKPWDKKILGISFLTTIAMFVIAGLDAGRFHWSPEFPTSQLILGIILTASGQLLFLIAQQQNKFFSSTVRIQTDRNHSVCDTGLYTIVRHPGYLGSLIQNLGFPILFGSVWSFIPVAISTSLILIRTQLEDQTLQTEFTGYKEYAAKVKFKIIPFIW